MLAEDYPEPMWTEIEAFLQLAVPVASSYLAETASFAAPPRSQLPSQPTLARWQAFENVTVSFS